MLGENNPICIFYHCYCMMSYYRWWLKQVSYPSVDNRANCKLQHFSERYCSYSCDIVCLTFSGPIYCYCHYICARVNKNKTRLERCWENILCLQCSHMWHVLPPGDKLCSDQKDYKIGAKFELYLICVHSSQLRSISER